MPRTRRKPAAPKGFVAQARAALTRKFGPLPAWAYFLIAALALYYYRKKTAAATTTAAVTGTPTASGSLYPSTPGGVTGSGSGSGSGSGGDGSGSGSGSGGGPPPPPPTSSITIWLHNPNHLSSGGKQIGSSYQYTGDPSTAAWFQVDGVWYYFEPGTYSNPYSNGNVAGQAWAYNDPTLPPSAGSPPSSSSAAATSQASSSTGRSITLPAAGASGLTSTVAPGAGIVTGHKLAAAPRQRGVILRTVTAGLRPRGWKPPPGSGHGPHWIGPPDRPPGQGPPPPPNRFEPSQAPASSTPAKTAAPLATGIGRARRAKTATGTADFGGRGRPRPLPHYSAAQVPSTPDLRDVKAVAVAPAQAQAGKHLAAGLMRSQARSVAMQAATGTNVQGRPSGSLGAAGARPRPGTRPARSTLGGSPVTGRARVGATASAKSVRPRGTPPLASGSRSSPSRAA